VGGGKRRKRKESGMGGIFVELWHVYPREGCQSLGLCGRTVDSSRPDSRRAGSSGEGGLGGEEGGSWGRRGGVRL
jgi:hypothetical protein